MNRSNTTSMHSRTYSSDSSRMSSSSISDTSASVFVAQRKDVVFEKPMEVDMSEAKPKPRPALLAKKSSVGLGSVFVSMGSEKERVEAGLSGKKSNGGLNMAFKFGGVAAQEVEKDESVRGNETFVSDDESANRERKP